MLGRTYKHIASGVISLVVAVISLSTFCLAATSPVVTTLSPVSQGLRSPVKLVMDGAGNYYVADQRLGVVKYSPYGAPLLTVKTSGVPMGVALALDGNLLVSQGSFVAAYNTTDGSEVSRFSGQLKGSSGLAVDNVTGYIYVADSAADEIQVYTAAGLFSRKIGTGSRGAGSILPVGQLSMPTGIVFEKSARQLVVADTLNNRIQFFDTNGNFIKSIGLPPVGVAGPMQFASPQAVAFEYTKDPVPVVSRMYVVDTFQSNIQVVDPTGTGTALIAPGALDNFIGSYGTANGQLMVPTDAVFDQKNNRLLVVNGYGNVSIFGIDGGTNPVDMTPPALSVDPVLSTVSVPNITISGSVAPGAQVSVVAGTSALVGAVTYSTATTWKCDVVNLAAGVNTFSITAKNSVGATTPVQSVSVNYVLPAPALSVSSSVPAVTNVSSLVLSGAVDAGSVVTVTNTLTAIGGNATVTGAAWSYTVSLSEGANNFAVTAQKALSSKAVVAVGVTLDTIAPVLSVSALSNGSYTSTQVQNISGSVADATPVSVTVNNAPAALVGKTFSVPVSLVNGKNVIAVVATDAAGNTATDVRTLYFDISKPAITIAAPMDNSFTNSAHLNVSGSVDKVATVTVAGAPAVVNSSNQWTSSVTLVAGSNTIEIVATDLYGNTSTVKRTVTLDTINPVVAITSPYQDSAFNKPSVTVAGTVSDNVSATVSYTLNGVTTPVPVISGNFTFNVNFAAEGVYAITVTAVDPAGNTTQAIRNLIYDITPPALTINPAAGYAPDTISGTVEAGASVVVKEGAVSIGTVSATGTTWSANLAGLSYDPQLLSVVATDAAGNSSVKTLVYNFPDGTLNADGQPTIQDALRVIRIVVNNSVPTPQEIAHYDIGPLLNGKPNPNGRLDLVDAILILRKALGLKSW